MAISKAQQKAVAKYKKANYSEVRVLISPKEKKANLQAHAAARGESLNGFVNRAIDEAVERDNAKGGGLHE